MIFFLFGAVFFLAFSNGANDNFKGVATLRKSPHYSYWRAITWATIWTVAGAVMSLWLARRLLPVFSGAQLISPDIDRLAFLIAVTCGAALTVFLAARIGMPISTTHALLGGLTGVAILSGGWEKFQYSSLISSAVIPLLLSPVIAVGLTRLTFPILRRVFPMVRDCICVSPRKAASAELIPATGLRLETDAVHPLPVITVDRAEDCVVHSSGARWRTNLNELIHWFSGGGISFARGVNDTPKIAALLLSPSLGISPWLALGGVAVAMALGGMLGAHKVARTISEKVTDIHPVEGTGANLVTAVLVTMASPLGLAVSTTHVSVGSIFGVATSQARRTDWRKVWQIVLSWLVTLPMGALLGSLCYLFIS